MSGLERLRAELHACERDGLSVITLGLPLVVKLLDVAEAARDARNCFPDRFEYASEAVFDDLDYALSRLKSGLTSP